MIRFLPSYKQRLRGEVWADMGSLIPVLVCTGYKVLGGCSPGLWLKEPRPSGKVVGRACLHSQLPDFWSPPCPAIQTQRTKQQGCSHSPANILHKLNHFRREGRDVVGRKYLLSPKPVQQYGCLSFPFQYRSASVLFYTVAAP